MTLYENILLAFKAIVANKLRTALTVLIIAFGIMALVGIFTSTEAITKKLTSSFSEMGSNTFSIKNEGIIRRRGGPKRKSASSNPSISLEQVNEFKERYKYPSVISGSSLCDPSAVVRYESTKTNPNVKMFGIDENYLRVSGTNVEIGRNFLKTECETGSDIILLGSDVMKKLMLSKDSVINKFVSIGSKKYRVIGVLASKGASQVSSDNQVMIPILNAKRTFGDDNTSYVVNVILDDTKEMAAAIDEAIGTMRSVRKLHVSDENNFEIIKSDQLANQLLDQLQYVRMATVVIVILTMLGAGVGLMNIMLVSVNERTREIGTSKALGATKKIIRTQFLTESVSICVLGGLVGTFLGLLLGNGVSLFMQIGFIMPWLLVLIGFVFTFIIGILAGLYPAIKASNLDPVDALRYE